jgi:hypothetical protein
VARSAWQPKVSHARFVVGAFSSDQMLTLGNILADKVGTRIRQGINASDLPSKPLKDKYAKFKQQKGRNPERDWTMSGNTLRALRCLTADENRATVGFNNPVANRIAHWNNLKERAFAVSPRDHEILVQAVNAVAKQARFVRVVSSNKPVMDLPISGTTISGQSVGVFGKPL